MSNDIINLLRGFYGESELSRAFFEILARRKNDTRVTKVDRILGLLLNDGARVVRQDVVRLMQRLSEMGLGKFVVGRHSKPSRFEWQTSALDAARAASGESNEIDLSAPPVSEAEQDDSGEEDMLEHRFHLRPDFNLTMELPVDLTPVEAERLAAFIKTLPLGPNS